MGEFTLVDRRLEIGSVRGYTYPDLRQDRPVRRAVSVASSRDELNLKLLLVAVFLPEGLSFFVGDFRLSLARVLLIVLSIQAVSRISSRSRNSQLVCVPSDILAPIAGIWTMIACTATDGLEGLKGAGMDAIEFTGAYFIFRYLLGPTDSTVRIVTFACKVMIFVILLALLDPLTGKLFTYELVKSFTGYVKPSYESALAAQAEALFRDGSIRAMGPLEHSILFGAVCIWFGTLAVVTFPKQIFGWMVAIIGLVGLLYSEARSPLAGYLLAMALAIVYCATPSFTLRWKIIGLLVTIAILVVFTFSGSPVATLVRLSGVSAESGWYRQAIWDTGVPVVLGSPIFGIGSSDDWGWQAHGGLVSASVDAFWLKAAMSYGIPGSLLILLTIVGAFWLGPVDRSPRLTPEERRLSVALGLVITTVVFLGFIVHFWGTCWILIASFAGIRANLAEAAIVRN